MTFFRRRPNPQQNKGFCAVSGTKSGGLAQFSAPWRRRIRAFRARRRDSPGTRGAVFRPPRRIFSRTHPKKVSPPAPFGDFFGPARRIRSGNRGWPGRFGPRLGESGRAGRCRTDESPGSPLNESPAWAKTGAGTSGAQPVHNLYTARTPAEPVLPLRRDSDPEGHCLRRDGKQERRNPRVPPSRSRYRIGGQAPPRRRRATIDPSPTSRSGREAGRGTGATSGPITTALSTNW